MTDAQRADKGMGVAEALIMVEDVACLIRSGLTDESDGDDLAKARDTLAAKLRAADALAEAARKLPLQIADCYVAGEASGDEYDDWRDGTAALGEALAAYKQAGMGGEG